AGGGSMKIANQSVPSALKKLGYSQQEIGDIMRYVSGSLSFEGAPHINRKSLKDKGCTDQDIANIEKALPGVFELTFALNRFTLGDEALQSLGFTLEQFDDPSFNLLESLGFTKEEIDEANTVICGHMTPEGAPHIKEEHLAVFDCASKCGKDGKRYISAEGHIRMMAAVQPFITGSISKTINLPHEATVEDIKQAYFLSWKLGLKSNALYRDGCKLSQPLSALSEKKDKKEKKEKKEVVERIVIKEVPRRRKLPDERMSITHKFSVAGHEGYLHVGLYEDGTPGEIFIKMSKEGSTLSGVMDTLALSLSMNLQYGVPLEVLCQKLVRTRFEPMGMTINKEIPMVKSLMDYLGRWLALKFLPREKAEQFHNKELVEMAYTEGTKSKDAYAMRLPIVDEGAQASAAPDYGSVVEKKTREEIEEASEEVGIVETKIAIARQQGFTGSMCGNCGSLRVKANGSCEVCLDCGATSGCS
ncbi:vitamin B12-dependent ribonucleotide reductase, partial [Patescibacteria group bacterium]|nr:vitamin B12-dependent ribonucleotide reductase [Patescibacteria group bacterium]